MKEEVTVKVKMLKLLGRLTEKVSLLVRMCDITWLRGRVEPLVFLAQFASCFFDTALQMAVSRHCLSQQTCMTNFYMTYTILSTLLPFLPAYLLARKGDADFRKWPLVFPLVGYVLSRCVLLSVLLAQLPLELMFGAAVLYGLSGGFSSYWAGVMALVSAASDCKQRSVRLMRVELVYGVAGCVSSILSGHLFNVQVFDSGQGMVLVACSVVLYLLCLLYTTLVLHVPQGRRSRESDHVAGSCCALSPVLLLFFTAAILYDVAVGGGMEVLVSYVMKPPLSWDSTLVGYGNAAGFSIFLTSFIGVLILAHWCSDITMIIIGMVSFSVGIYFMAFVTATYMYFLARALMLFSLIPMPTIRSQLSKHVQQSSSAFDLYTKYKVAAITNVVLDNGSKRDKRREGKVLVSLQLSLSVASLVYSPLFTKVYQATLNWLPGFAFLLSSALAVFAIIPVSIVGCRMARQEEYDTLPSN